jgi:FtsZ-binding cell division protein ZapB
MAQPQVHSSDLPLHYWFSYQVIVIIRVIVIGFILVGLLLKIKKQIKNYIDTINLLEYKLNEITKKYDTICSEIVENDTITSELTSKITTCNENIRDLENNLYEINDTITLNDELMKSACSSLHSQISNNRILIGYRIYSNETHDIFVPVFEPIDASTIFDPNTCDWFIVNQLKYFKNIKKINLMTAVNKMFIFGNPDLNKLSGRSGHKHRIYDVTQMVQENNPNYFMVWQDVFCYTGDGFCLFKQPYNVQMYAKNRVKKLYEQLLEMDIELTMPNELRDYCL